MKKLKKLLVPLSVIILMTGCYHANDKHPFKVTEVRSKTVNSTVTEWYVTYETEASYKEFTI